MRAVLEFDLPEDEDAHELACRAGRMASAMREVAEELRRLEKYGHEMKTAEVMLAHLKAFWAEVTGGLLG